MTEASPQAVIPTGSPSQQDKQSPLDVGVLSTTISVAVSQAVQAALSGENLAAILMNSVPTTPNPVLPSVEDEVQAITEDNRLPGIGGVPANARLGEPQPQQTFTSIAVALSSRVSARLKSKIWANEYIDFGALLFSSLKMRANFPYL